MSLLTTASPYHSKDDGNESKNSNKKISRRKATMPPISSSSSEAKKYMSQLIQNKEPQPSLSSYSGASMNDFYSYKPSEITDMLYPTLEDTPTKNMVPIESTNMEIENPLKGEEILRANNALPSNLPSFSKNNKSQKSGITSALQKLTGSKTITQEGMMDISSLIEEDKYQNNENNIKNQAEFQPPYVPKMPAFSLNRNENANDFTPSPIDYLKAPANSPNMFSDYSTSYSSSNYVVPPNLSQYSYPIMRPSTIAAANAAAAAASVESMENIYQQEYIHEVDKTQQILLEKINYMIYLLEQQKKEKTNHTTEEFILYSFLGVFVIYVADSFARSGRYIR